MSLFRQLDRVRAAQAELAAHRAALSGPAGALLARGRRYPLTTLGVLASVGFALGGLELPRLRLPGLAGVLRGGLAEAVTQAMRWFDERGDGAA